MKSLLILPFALAAVLSQATAAPPSVGQRAPDFTLAAVSGATVRLSEVIPKGPVVLVVLRGYRGYQCPYCNRQVQDFIQNAQGFAEAGVRLIMAYPGPPKDLAVKASEFLTGKKLPNNFDLLLDPGYEFTNLYGLRWDALNETAYPSTFLIDAQGVIFFSKIVKVHGGRTTAAEILDALPKRKAAR